MARLDLEGLIKPDRYQVFLVSSPASFPVNFARHAWFIINKKGAVDRFEVIHAKWPKGEHWGYIYKNFQKPSLGVTVIPFLPGWYWKDVDLLGSIEGDENSIVHKMVDFIEDSSKIYTNKNIYKLFGPNSNTYVAWVLNNFPDFKHKKLSWRYIGKDFKSKKTN